MASYMYYPNYAAPQQQPYHGHSQSMGAIPPMNTYGYYQPPVQQQPQPYYHHHHQSQPQHQQSASYHQILPPPGMSYMMPPHMAAPHVPSAPAPVPVPAPAQQQEQVNGGVSEVLDYDLETMSDFIVKNAYLAFDNDEAITSEGSEVVEIFTKGVASVLNATRLPSVTIYLALDYLCKYIGKLPQGAQTIGGEAVNVIYQNLMVAFVLANKFNDDKTFTNKSWSHATGMDTSVINQLERDWLVSFEWKLFDDRFVLYDEYVTSFEIFCNERMAPAPVPAPFPTTTNNYLSAPQQQTAYQTPAPMPAVVYSSPCFTDDRSDSCNSFYQPSANFASPISNGCPTPRDTIKRYNYYNAPASVANSASNSFWNTPFDDMKRKDDYGINTYGQYHQFPQNNGYHCFSTAY